MYRLLNDCYFSILYLYTNIHCFWTFHAFLIKLWIADTKWIAHCKSDINIDLTLDR